MKPTLLNLSHRINTIFIYGIFVLFFQPASIRSQNFNHPLSGFSTHTLSAGVYHYYDNGGSTGNYSNNLSSGISFIPEEGHFLTWQVLSYNIESNPAACGGSCC